MDYSLQVHQAKYIFPIPDGLKELSSDIIREVLRHQPKHINGFIADYLETMLTVREQARDCGVIVCEAFREGYFFDELFSNKNINRDEANAFATIIQAAWRGYVVRRKLSEWLKKKKKFQEEQQRKRNLKIEELLAGLGITYDEAKRAAGVIQAAYKESKRGKWLPAESGEYWVDEVVPLGQRIREGDRALGRYDRWEKEDFGDFFEMDEAGAIKYVWPRVGQLRKVLREDVPKNALLVEFFAMRDLDGQEQYSYLIKTQPDSEVRGSPVGFIVPLPRSCMMECSQEIDFIDIEYAQKMGCYTYIFRDDVDKTELKSFEDILKTQAKKDINLEYAGELDYDPNWVLPRVLVRIKKEHLLETDLEVKFVSLPEGVVCEKDNYTFRAETPDLTLKIIRHILRDKCISVEDGLVDAANMSPYKFQETGRIFPVEDFTLPSYIQKIEITPETETANEEVLDLMRYTFIFLPVQEIRSKKYPRGEPIFSISVTRFQGFHSDYRGSEGLQNKVFIMGPKVTTPNGKPFTYESLFWEEFGIEAWYQLLYNYDSLQEAVGECDEKEEQEEAMLTEAEDFKGESVREGESQRKIDKIEVSEVSEAKPAPETPSRDITPVPATPPPSEILQEGEGENKLELEPIEPQAAEQPSAEAQPAQPQTETEVSEKEDEEKPKET